MRNLFASRFTDLSAEERVNATRLAYMMGADAATKCEDRFDASPGLYFIKVIIPAQLAGDISPLAFRLWTRELVGENSTADPRVAQWIAGWAAIMREKGIG